MKKGFTVVEIILVVVVVCFVGYFTVPPLLINKNTDLKFACVDACAFVINALPPYCSKEEYMCKDLKYVSCYTDICGCDYQGGPLHCNGVSINKGKIK